MTADNPAREAATVQCKNCNFEGPIHEYHPTISAYSDIRCPKCGSTNNKHNSEYQDRLFAAMREG